MQIAFTQPIRLDDVVIVQGEYGNVEEITPPMSSSAAGISTTKLWDGKVNNVQITNLKEHTMEVRCLISAANSGNSSDLASLIREKMIEFVRTNYPAGLPRTRLETDSPLELKTNFAEADTSPASGSRT